MWLSLGGWHVLDDDLRWLRDEAAPSRDLDVQLGMHPPAGWARELRRRRAEARGRLLRALGDPRMKSLLSALASLPPVPLGAARREARRLSRRALSLGKKTPFRSADVEPIHRLRRSVRRVRFALEWLCEDASEVKSLQDALGEVCDRANVLRSLDDPSVVGIKRYRRKLSLELGRASREARATWKRTRRALEALL